jgi:5-methyltetrahydrofolate--homocysteine methyltransferase
MSTLRIALAERVVVADGAMGTMLQASDATIDDFAGYEGCNEILNVTRPDIVTGIHEAYLDAGADCVTTNSFGANLSNLGEYGISGRIAELSEASAQLARAAADRWATPGRPRWVLGSIGPGTKLPTLGHTTFRELRDSYLLNAAGLCPDLADRAKIVRLLEPSRIGVELSEEMQLHPEQSTDAIVAHHPEAKYFSV